MNCTIVNNAQPFTRVSIEHSICAKAGLDAYAFTHARGHICHTTICGSSKNKHAPSIASANILSKIAKHTFRLYYQK